MNKKIKSLILGFTTILGILLTINFVAKSPIRAFVVLSGSMKPKIYEGSIVFVNKNLKNFKKNDIVTFVNPINNEENVTHRIEREKKIREEIFYKTKGDANNEIDLWEVPKELVLGKVFLTIPYLGYLVNFCQTKIGVVLIIILPLTLIVLDEIKNIFREIKKIRNKVLILLLAFLVLPNFGKTYAKFTASTKTNNQKIQTGYWQPMTSTINNNEVTRNQKDIEINYSVSNQKNLDFVQLCFSYNLENFECPNISNFKSTDGKFYFHFDKDGIWSFYTIYNGKNGQNEDLSDLDSKIYKIQIDTQAPTTNLNITSLPYNKYFGQNLIINGSFENGDGNWNISNGNGDHHAVNIGEGIGETIIPMNGNNMFEIGFKDFSLQNNLEDSIYQIVSIPQNLSTDLSFWSRLLSYDVVDYDQFKVQIRQPDDKILEDVLITGNINGIDTFDSGWKNYSRSLGAYSGQTIKLWFGITNNGIDDGKKTWGYLDDIKITTLNARIGETFTPEIIGQDFGSGILETSTLPEIQTGENILNYNSSDIAGNREQPQQSNILVLANVTLNKFDGNFIELNNNSSDEIDLNEWQICNKNNCMQLSGLKITNQLNVPINFSFEENDKIVLKNNFGEEVDNFNFSEIGNWQRNPSGIGTWFLADKPFGVNLVSRLQVNKITMSIFGIPNSYGENPNDRIDYEITYTSNSIEKGFGGTISKNTIENNKTDRDFYLGTCSSGGACVDETNIGPMFKITLTGVINNQTLEPIIKNFTF